MQTALNIAMIIVSVVLIALILLQTKGSSFSGAFGGDPGSINRTRRGVEKTLFQLAIASSFLV
jgi:preprotein translocase subunit SecG